MEKIPILQMGKLLLVTIQVDLYDRLAETLEADLVQMINKTGAQGVLIDISAVNTSLPPNFPRLLNISNNIAGIPQVSKKDTGPLPAGSSRSFLATTQ